MVRSVDFGSDRPRQRSPGRLKDAVMLREIVLDTETTGLDAKRGDRLIEIGCVEIVNRRATGVEFHRFVNPAGKDVHPDAERVHGISNAFLNDKPLFSQVAADFLTFIGDSTLVIHNASFDIGFINMELEKIKRPPLQMDRVVDTLLLARRKHPAGPNTLDGLCKRYGIDNTQRTKHGAIVDSLLLADVYLELLGERQAMLGLSASDAGVGAVNGQVRGGSQRHQPARQRPQPLAARLTAADEAAHAKFVESLGPNAIWKKLSAATAMSA
jgi:DNA polymerase III subunit epsilon